ncbi:hypothetical protein GJ496_007952 [Pomphorhynchus laevis]|nr:hypothetical protein GJ496_007952 [Pomphorhynchus laevis]
MGGLGIMNPISKVKRQYNASLAIYSPYGNVVNTFERSKEQCVIANRHKKENIDINKQNILSLTEKDDAHKPVNTLRDLMLQVGLSNADSCRNHHDQFAEQADEE